jgi:hypothetical protein
MLHLAAGKRSLLVCDTAAAVSSLGEVMHSFLKGGYIDRTVSRQILHISLGIFYIM